MGARFNVSYCQTECMRILSFGCHIRILHTCVIYKYLVEQISLIKHMIEVNCGRMRSVFYGLSGTNVNWQLIRWVTDYQRVAQKTPQIVWSPCSGIISFPLPMSLSVIRSTEERPNINIIKQAPTTINSCLHNSIDTSIQPVFSQQQRLQRDRLVY